MGSNAKASEVLAAIRKMAEQPFVLSISDQYASEWDELAIFITVADRTKDTEVIRFGNTLLAYLNQMLPRGNPYFIWQVQLRRQDKVVDVLFPGERLRKPGALRLQG